MQHNHPNIDEESFKKLFPDKLTKTFRKPWPNHEKNLTDYVSNVLSDETDIDNITDALLYTARIDMFNDSIHYWIIKTAFDKLSHQDFRKFLVRLIPCIPQSTFLWFYLQQADKKSHSESEWKILFAKYNPENIQIAMQEIDENAALKYLTEDILKMANFTCIHYAKGKYKEALKSCVEIISLFQDIPENHITEMNLCTNLLALCYQQTSDDEKKSMPTFLNPDCSKSYEAINETESGNYENAIILFEAIFSNSKELLTYQEPGLYCLYRTAGKCYEKTEKYSNALSMFEVAYYKSVNLYGYDGVQTVANLEVVKRLIAKATENEIPKKTSHPCFYNNPPHKIYEWGMVLLNSKTYPFAIKYFNVALAEFTKKQLISRESFDCYSALTNAYLESGKLLDAQRKCAMAYVIACQVYKNDDQFLIEEELHLIEAKLALQQHGQNSKAYKNSQKILIQFYTKLGKHHEESNEKEKSQKAYTMALGIYEKCFGTEDQQTIGTLQKPNQTTHRNRRF